MRTYMLDIETASTHTHNALVLSIACLQYTLTPQQPIINRTLCLYPRLRDQIALGRQTDIDSLKWWALQKPEARRNWTGAVERSVADCLYALADFLSANPAPRKDVQVWAHGVCFDVGNLEQMYRSLEIQIPWQYNGVRDARTITAENPKLRVRPEVNGRPLLHDPVVDCQEQIWDQWERQQFPNTVGAPL